MKFNDNWTKADNDQMRKMIKEHKTVDDIRMYFGNDKLYYHPKQKYYIKNKQNLNENNIWYPHISIYESEFYNKKSNYYINVYYKNDIICKIIMEYTLKNSEEYYNIKFVNESYTKNNKIIAQLIQENIKILLFFISSHCKNYNLIYTKINDIQQDNFLLDIIRKTLIKYDETYFHDIYYFKK